MAKKKRKYPKPFVRAITKAEQGGGRLLLVIADEGFYAQNYTALIDMAGVMVIISVDVVGGKATAPAAAYIPVAALDKARAMMEGGHKV